MAIRDTAPKVSVIVPNYNHAPFVRQRIDTILAQTFQDFELILLDDCSTDDSRSILSSYSNDPHVSAIQFNERNSGSTFKQWNKGVLLARGEYIWIAESDDYADPHFLERLVAVLDSKPQVVLVSCRSWYVSSNGEKDGFAGSYFSAVDPERWASDYCVSGREECRRHLVVVNSVPNASSVLFRKTIYEQVGRADESLRLCGDWKLWALMALLGDVAYVAEPLNHFRSHDSTMRAEGAKQGLFVLEHAHTVRWILGRVTPAPATMQTVRQRLSDLWIPAMTRGHVPFARRCKIFVNAVAIDPKGSRKLLKPLWGAVCIKASQRLRLLLRRGGEA